VTDTIPSPATHALVRGRFGAARPGAEAAAQQPAVGRIRFKPLGNPGPPVYAHLDETGSLTPAAAGGVWLLPGRWEVAYFIEPLAKTYRPRHVIAVDAGREYDLDSEQEFIPRRDAPALPLTHTDVAQLLLT